MFHYYVTYTYAGAPPGETLTVQWSTSGRISTVTIVAQKAGSDPVYVDHVSNSLFYQWTVHTILR